MTYDKCVDCERDIEEGHVYRCCVMGCGAALCLNCVEMAGGYDFCRFCYAKGSESILTKRDLLNQAL